MSHPVLQDNDFFGGLLPLLANVSILGQCLFHWLLITRWINNKLCLLYVTTSGQIIRSNHTNTKAEWRLHVPFERQKCINYVSEPLCASFSSNLTWDWNLHKQRKFELVQTFVTKIILLKVILLLNMIMEQLTVKIQLTTEHQHNKFNIIKEMLKSVQRVQRKTILKTMYYMFFTTDYLLILSVPRSH